MTVFVDSVLAMIFHADIHQPLHTGWGGDSGGNKIVGKYFGANNVNLHTVWDTNILGWRDNDFGGQRGYVSWLVAQVDTSNASAAFAANVPQWRLCPSAEEEGLVPGVCPDAWVAESIDIACRYAYTNETGGRVVNGFVLGEDYQKRANPIIDVQMARCGVRLAHILNGLFVDQPLPDPPAYGAVQVQFNLRAAVDSLSSTALANDVVYALRTNASRVSVQSLVAGTIENTTVAVMLIQEPGQGDAAISAAQLGASLVESLNSPSSDLFTVGTTSRLAVVGSGSIRPAGAADDSSSTGGAGGSDSSSSGGTGGAPAGKDSDSGSILPVGGIAGIVIAGVAAVAALALLYYCCIYTKAKRKTMNQRMKGSQQSIEVDFGGTKSPSASASRYATSRV
jgi:hypothetical protein